MVSNMASANGKKTPGKRQYVDSNVCAGCVPTVSEELVKMVELVCFDEKKFVVEMVQRHIYVSDVHDKKKYIRGTGQATPPPENNNSNDNINRQHTKLW